MAVLFQATINVLAGKWKVMILWHLSFGPKRFDELRDVIPDVTEKVLTGQLRQLEADGVIGRRKTADVPPRVTYFLSRSGQKVTADGRFVRLGQQAFWNQAHIDPCVTRVQPKADSSLCKPTGAQSGLRSV